MACSRADLHEDPYFGAGIMGYMVYRLTYKDQKLSEDYLDYVRRAIIISADQKLADDLWAQDDLPPEREADMRDEAENIESWFHLCPREGPELDGMPLEQARELHGKWQQGLYSRPPAGVLELAEGSDEQCPDEDGNEDHRENGNAYGDEEQHEDEESNMIWQYFHIFRLSSFYTSLSEGNSAWFDAFAWPPKINRLDHGMYDQY